MVEIRVYEDNAGGLHLWEVGQPYYWSELQETGSTFAEDVQGILEGDTVNWTVPRYPVASPTDFSGLDLIATWRNEPRVLHDAGAIALGPDEPGAAGHRYLAQ